MTLSRVEPMPDTPVRSRRRGAVVALVIVALLGGVGWSAARVNGGGALGQDPFGRKAPAFQLPRVQGDRLDRAGRPPRLACGAELLGRMVRAVPSRSAGPGPGRTALARPRGGLPRHRHDRSDGRCASRSNVDTASTTRASPTRRGDLQAAYGVFGFPETFFIGRDGTIVAKYVGVIDRATLDAEHRLDRTTIGARRPAVRPPDVPGPCDAAPPTRPRHHGGRRWCLVAGRIRRLWKRSVWGKLGVFAAFGFVGLVAGTAIGVKLTEGNRFCGYACHEMVPYAQSWEVSKHSKLTV